MCRHLCYLGSPLPPAELVLDPPHSLLRQSYAPADMRCGARMNADGFGIGWYGGDRAYRYRRDCPMWSDPNLDDLCRAVRTPALLAAVRSATAGMPLTEAACAPFSCGRWLFSHNGVVPDWQQTMAGAASRLPAAELLALPARTDAGLLWALLRARLAAGQPPGTALAGLVAETARASRDAGEARLNLLLTDGTMGYATTWRHSLWTLDLPGAAVVASEPYDDDPGWQQVPDEHLVVARPGRITVTALQEVVLA